VSEIGSSHRKIATSCSELILVHFAAAFTVYILCCVCNKKSWFSAKYSASSWSATLSQWGGA